MIKDIRRIPLCVSVLIAGLMLLLFGCSVSPFGEQGKFRYKPQVLEERFCIGKYEIKKPLENGPFVDTNPTNLFFMETLDGIDQYYVEQRTLTSCWSAALETALKYAGLNFTQEHYRRALRDHCPLETSDAATANQILFAASETHAPGKGIWVGQTPDRGLDIDWCHLVNWAVLIPGIEQAQCFSNNGSTQNKQAPDISEFYALDFVTGKANSSNGITMYNRDAKFGYEKNIILISSLKELLVAMDKRYPVVVGMNQLGGGHVVNLKTVVFHTAQYYKNPGEEAYTYTIRDDSYLDYVFYLDPMRGSDPIKMDGDEFLDTVEFAFYVEH